ncbi:DNA polymerase III subunit chi [Pseudomonas sp. F1_0610]|uniref:DNA polymerase III subunit chi n=1 Tax=Pseudomonas sp. F1_0610 TaxID=3114284 RepID=UPI0039C2CD1C
MRVEFYVLPSQAMADRLHTACRLALKGWRSGMPVFIRAQDTAQCSDLDQRLWTFRQDTFVPHCLAQDSLSSPVIIGIEQQPLAKNGLLINLHPSPCEEHQHFSRIIEIVNQEPSLLEQCRDHFRYYRNLGLNPMRVEL